MIPSLMQCRFIDTGARDGFTNMAVDEALLRHAAAPILRLYQWKPAAVSIGYNQNAEKEIDAGYCEQFSIPIVRRITGGKAVFHDAELTYSFIVPGPLGLLPSDVTGSFKKIADALVRALEMVGIRAEIMKQRERIATPVCFGSSNWYELKVKGRKICGSAQRRFNNAVIQHGSILLDFDFSANAAIFGTELALRGLKGKVTSIGRETDEAPDIRKVKASLKKGFKEAFGFEMVESDLDRNESTLAGRLKREKYATQGWNVRKMNVISINGR
jgi:lipoyl(octanoyl) transferase